jgi:hypothetical protein
VKFVVSPGYVWVTIHLKARLSFEVIHVPHQTGTRAPFNRCNLSGYFGSMDRSRIPRRLEDFLQCWHSLRGPLICPKCLFLLKANGIRSLFWGSLGVRGSASRSSCFPPWNTLGKPLKLAVTLWNSRRGCTLHARLAAAGFYRLMTHQTGEHTG